MGYDPGRMAPLKFRAWHKDRKEMLHIGIHVVEVDEWGDKNRKKNLVLEWPNHGKPGDIDSWAVWNHYQTGGEVVCNENAGVLMQSTGLTDDEGNEIFEGDILEFEEPKFESAMLKCPVVFCEGAFCAEWDRGSRQDWFLLSEIDGMKVIGNIYENPDLFPQAA